MTNTKEYNEPIVCLEIDENSVYPKEDFAFSPSENYPEYKFPEIATTENRVYALVRHTLVDLGLDVDNFGKSSWNPLGTLLKPGQTVLIKPNFVMHENENKNLKNNAMECLVTHPSCLRAIVDYCIIALSNENGIVNGKIEIADAPMQGCIFDELIKKMHVDILIDYYQGKGIEVTLVDLRQYESTFNKSKVIVGRKYTDSHGTIVHMGDKSMHCTSDGNGEYRVSDYDKSETMSFHNGEIHDYEIAEDILKADLLINFCKPKTHRLAGFTGAQKNIVGTTYNKASLPHRTAGSKSEGGDAYLNKNLLKKMAEESLIIKARAEKNNKTLLAFIMRYCYGAFLVAGRTFGKDNYYIGSWYGNDTIWRTIVDLNYIIQYANKDGVICNVPQRKVLHFADMIIAGQKNGPVKPEPKELGVISASFDSVALDFVICKIMGFDSYKIPLLKAIKDNETWIRFVNPLLKSNKEGYNTSFEEICFPQSWKFKPHEAWEKVLSN